MRIDEFIAKVLDEMPSDGWGQIDRSLLISHAKNNNVQDPVLCADACHSLGIGELKSGETAGEVIFSFSRPIERSSRSESS